MKGGDKNDIHRNKNDMVSNQGPEGSGVPKDQNGVLLHGDWWFLQALQAWRAVYAISIQKIGRGGLDRGGQVHRLPVKEVSWQQSSKKMQNILSR